MNEVEQKAMDATHGETVFIEIIARTIAPNLFEGGGDRMDAAMACARLAGSILAEMVESGSVNYASFPLLIDQLNTATVDEFDKFITGGGGDLVQ